jgi:hypothetical protein
MKIRNIGIFFILAILVSCDGNKTSLPEGYELIATDGRTHFVHIDEDKLEDRIVQREVGKKICTELFNHEDYCEVYMWTDRAEIPTKLPIINRRSMIGVYEMKNGNVKHKPLTGK